jgi:hypothetical protein
MLMDGSWWQWHSTVGFPLKLQRKFCSEAFMDMLQGWLIENAVSKTDCN